MEEILEKIYKAGLKFLVPLNPKEVHALIVEEALELVGGEFGSILLEQDGELHRVYASAPSLYKIKPRKRGYTYGVFKTRKPIILSSKEIAKVHPEIKQTQAQADIIVPLSYRHKSIGVLSILSSKRDRFTSRELNILKLFGQMASLAIRKSQLYDETRQALETRDLFISMAAHELRTPLTSINGYVQLLYSKLAGGDNVESRWIEQLYWESVRLTNLVSELLEINRIKSGQLNYQFKECSLREVIKRALVDLKFAHPKRRVVFEDRLNSYSDRVIGDFNKLLQMISNILENAIKFSSASSRVFLTLKGKSQALIVEVKDQGKGISEEEMGKVFEGFYRGKDTQTEGMGIGLFLAKNIVIRHHGTINLRSKPNKGTTVNIRLPRAKL